MDNAAPSTAGGAVSDRDRLFGVLAVQLCFVTPGDMGRAAEPASDTSLPDRLVAGGLMQAKDRDLILGLADRLIAAHRGDAHAALLAFGGDRAVAHAFAAPVPAPSASASESTMALTEHDLAQVAATAPGAARLAAAASLEHITLEHPGRYVIKAEHGRGAIGRVLVAFDEHIGRDIALKELMTELIGDSSMPSETAAQLAAEAAARFLQEARITGQLEHPGIVPVYEIARRDDGSIFYTMKLVRGQTLADKLKEIRERGTGNGERGKEAGPPSLSSPSPVTRSPSLSSRLSLLPHFHALCQAVAFAHSNNVVHRDLKPANVMIGEFGETVVLDWGIASVKGLADERASDIEESLRLIKEAGASETVEGVPIGTPAYMSPEQARGQVSMIDERSDVWSLGAILYEILAGQVPFAGRLARDVMRQVIEAPVVPVTVREPRAPAELAAIAMKCLDRDPDRRYANANEIARDVSHFISGGLVSAYEYSMAALIARWVRKRWPLVATAAIALIVLAVSGALSWVRINAERDRAVASEAVAQKKEAEALENLSESYLIMGRWAESAREWESAQVYFAKSLELHDTLEARVSLNHVSVFPRLRLAAISDMEQHPGIVWDMVFAPDGKAPEGKAPEIKALAVARDPQAINLFDAATGKIISRFHQTDFSPSIISLSPAGNFLAAASPDGRLLLYDLLAGRLAHDLKGHRAPVAALAFAPDGLTLATASRDSVIKLWDTAAGAETHTLEWDRDDVAALVFSPDGGLLATGNADGRVKIWDPAAGDLLFRLEAHEGAVSCIAFSPDGAALVSGSADTTARVWDTAAGELRYTLEGHKDEVLQAVVAPDGITAATAGADHSIRLWDIETGALLHYLEGHQGAVYSLAISPDGSLLASNGNDMFLKLWDLETGAQLFSRGGQIGLVAIAPDGKRLFSSGQDYTLKIWEIIPEPLFRAGSGEVFPAEVLAQSPAGDLIAAGNAAGEIALFRTSTRQLLRALPAHQDAITALTFAPDGSFLVSAARGPGLKIHDPATGELVRELDPGGHEITVLAAVPGGRTIAGAGADRVIRLWDPTTGQKTAELPGHESEIEKVLFTPDGTVMLSVGYLENTVRLWELPGGKSLPGFDFGLNYVDDAALSPDGKILAAGLTDNSVQVYDLASRARLHTLEGHECSVRAVAFSPDGKTIASASCDQTVKLWDVRDGARLASMARHKDSVEKIALSPDGTILASASRDLTIKLWAMPAGALLHSLDTGLSDPVSGLAFSPDGKSLISFAQDHSIRLWALSPQIMTGNPAQLLRQAERATGLKVLGMKLHPWKPATGQVSASPMPQGL